MLFGFNIGVNMGIEYGIQRIDVCGRITVQLSHDLINVLFFVAHNLHFLVHIRTGIAIICAWHHAAPFKRNVTFVLCFQLPLEIGWGRLYTTELVTIALPFGFVHFVCVLREESVHVVIVCGDIHKEISDGINA